jgi:hypothetical protein
MKNRIVICDIDGTVADGTHRLHFVKTKPKNWPAYVALGHLDLPIWPVIQTIKALSIFQSIIFVSGREETQRDMTVNWLRNVADFEWDITPNNFYMRPAKDYREDSIIKREILHKFILPKYEVLCAFDDRPRVKKMWREEGIFVMNVQQGEVDF